MTTTVDPALIEEYEKAGWWGRTTLADHVARHAAARPDAAAYVTTDTRLSWHDYDRASSALAGALAGLGLAPGDRVATLLPDGPTVHVSFIAAEKAGLTTVGVGARAGEREVRHILGRTGAKALVTHARHRGRETADLVHDLRAAGLPLDHHVVVPDYAAEPEAVPRADGVPVPVASDAAVEALVAARRLGPNDLFMINSTSGTTGLPKCVMHTQNRWFYFHLLAREAGELSAADVVMSVIPAPFGFGLWTSHFTPTILGVPAVVTERFDAGAALDLVERERVSVLCCVSTQFMMMLDEQERRKRDLSSLRCMFTGGEAVPYHRAAEFEDRTGARVLQFYGSNETGALSYTSMADDRERRLRTAGRIIPEMRVRLFDAAGADITGTGRRGRPGCRGPATCLGYLDDPEANGRLFTEDGWMLMADEVEIDDAGYLRVVGRLSDLIIRGGKNISAPAVEEEVGTHPAVAMAAAVPAPDPTFGERVCVYVTLRPGHTLTLEDLAEHLGARGTSKEWFPEHLVVVDSLPRSSGGKVAKARLREDIARRLSGEGTAPL
ncbi:AMP-binding protein [Actinomadura sp. SCN-SB]|uniref:class I adenylate-forming enzyme family protein n=1 Tax=Actinomadura sp. SCN-SB TaxID=3373092 RepID=UPI0037530243